MTLEKSIGVESAVRQGDEKKMEASSKGTKASVEKLAPQVPRARTGYPYITGPRLWIVLYG